MASGSRFAAPYLAIRRTRTGEILRSFILVIVRHSFSSAFEAGILILIGKSTSNEEFSLLGLQSS